MAKKTTGQKKTTEQLQKEYDEMIITIDRLQRAVDQAAKTFEWYNDASKREGGEEVKPGELRMAELNRNKAVAELYAYKQLIAAKRGELETNKKIKKRTVQDIEAEKSPQEGFSFANFKSNLKKKGGGNTTLGVFNLLGEAFGVVSDIVIAQQKKNLNTWMAEQDIYLKTLETGSKIFNRHMKTFAKGMEGAVTSSFASITQGVQEGAYAAAASSIDFASDMLKNTYEDKLDRLKLLNYQSVRQAQVELENLKYTNQQLNGGVGLASSIAGLFGPIGEAAGSLVSSITKNVTKMMEASSEIEFEKLKKQVEVDEAKLEKLNEAQSNAVDAAKQMVTNILDFSKSIENLSLKTDAAAKSMANIIGMSGSNADMYERFIYSATRNLKFTDSTGKTTYLNKNAEDMLKMQSQYIDASGRNGTMTQNDFVKTFQLGQVIGDDNLAATLLGDMDYFNKSIATGTDLIYEMFQQANKAGVSNRKFAKDLQQNLQLAQKYTFKGGVEAMMKMSIWAQKTRFNMQSLEGMVDKIQNGGLEGVITQGAKLQVLGGNMAMGADPLAMMYESWADPETLAKRFTDMTKGMGYFNPTTGEVDIVGPDAMRLKAYAETIGMDYKDARAQVTQRIKGEQIDRQLTQSYTPEQKALIYNKAKLGKDGQWQVTLDNGDVRNVNDLKDTDWNSLMPTEESIEDYVAKIYNLLDQQKGATNYGQSVLADETYENLVKNIKDRIIENLNFVNQNTGKLKEILEKANKFSTEQNGIQHSNMLATTDILDTEFNIMKNSVKLFSKTMTDASSELRTALDAVNTYLISQLNPTNENINNAARARDNLANKTNIAPNDRLNDRSNAETWYNKKNLGQEALDDNYVNYAYDMFTALNQSEGLSDGNLDRLAAKYIDIAGIGWTDLEEDGYETSQNIADILRNFRELYLRGKINALGQKIEHGSKIDEDNYLHSEFGKNLERAIRNAEMFNNLNGDFSSDTVYESIRNNYQNGAFVRSKDALMSGNGKPLITAATSVTPINDGVTTIAQSDPQDHAIFAKTGGPFDTLFNGIFAKINEISDVLPRSMEYIMPLEKGLNEINNSKGTANNSKIQIEPLKIELNGKLELNNSNGQSVDILNEIKNNPILLRTLTQLISESINKTINGGKSTYTGGIVSPRFN